MTRSRAATAATWQAVSGQVLDVVDMRTLRPLSVVLDPERHPDEVLDPQWVRSHRLAQPDTWPHIGTALQGWQFALLASPRERVCPLVLAIESRRHDLVAQLLQALQLRDAPASMREHAGRLVRRGLAALPYLDAEHVPYMHAITMLMAAGASPQATARCWGHATMRMPEDIARLAGGQAASGEAACCSALAVLVLDPGTCVPSPHLGLQAYEAILAQDRSRALKHREKAFQGASLAHLCVTARRCDALEITLRVLGKDCCRLRDRRGRTPLALAHDLAHHECASLLQSFEARRQARLALAHAVHDERYCLQ